MKKKLFYLFALICSVGLFTACSDDEPEYIQDGEFDGVYLGSLNVDAAGVIKVDDIPQKVYITKTGENQFKMELKKFSFQTMELGDISVDDIKVVKEGNNCSFTGQGNLNLAVGKCDVTVSGTIEGEKLKMDISVLAAGTLNVKVDFTGNKLAKDKSSEAKILTFTFDNEFVTSQPVIDHKSKTITFIVSDEISKDQLNALVPVFTISEGASVDKESGVAQNFSEPVKYTVTSEDGIVKMVYTVSIAGKGKFISFNEWETVKSNTSGSKEEFQTLKGTYGTSNPGVMSINEMFAEALKEPFEYCVTPVDGKEDKAAQLKTIHTAILAGGMDYNEAFGGLIPYVTAGSLFSGIFKTDMDNPLNSTKFGVPYVGEPVTFTGWYKYVPGEIYYDNTNKIVEGKSDKCSIYAVLYEESLDEDGNNIPLTGNYKDKESYIGTSSRIVMRADLKDGSAKSEWTEFSIPFESVGDKKYDASKNYYIAIVCSSSFEGDLYKGAPGSTLTVDNFSVVSK